MLEDNAVLDGLGDAHSFARSYRTTAESRTAHSTRDRNALRIRVLGRLGCRAPQRRERAGENSKKPCVNRYFVHGGSFGFVSLHESPTNRSTWMISILPTSLTYNQTISAMTKTLVADAFIVHVNEGKQSRVNEA